MRGRSNPPLRHIDSGLRTGSRPIWVPVAAFELYLPKTAVIMMLDREAGDVDDAGHAVHHDYQAQII